jgi:chromosome segregation ATPase
MSSEDFDRNMDVVAAHLASLAVRQDKLQEAQSRSEARLDRVERVLGTAIRVGLRRLNSLTAAQERTTEALARLAESQARTDAKMSETDERLNILVNAVERYISERRNGRGGNGPAGGQ